MESIINPSGTIRSLNRNAITLRPLRPDDLDAIFRLRSNEQVNRYIKRVPARNIADAQAWLDRILPGVEKGDNFNWGITTKAHPAIVGSICLWNFSADRKKAEAGYDLLPAWQGKGFMREALDLVLEFGFSELGLNMIDAYTQYNNTASRKLLDKAGFVQNAEKTDSDNADNIVLELNRLQWLRNRAGSRLEFLLDHIPSKLAALTAEELENIPSPGKWSKAMIMGHLIDSAANNHQRFVRAQFEDVPLIGYDPDLWNGAGQYRSMPVNQVLDFWEAYNRHIWWLMSALQDEQLAKKVNCTDRVLTLSEVYLDYVTHLEHHLHQVINY